MYNKVMCEMKCEWCDKVSIMTCFADEQQELVDEHINKMNVGDLHNTWLVGGWSEGNYDTVDKYTNRTPSALLIDMEGKVRWKGFYLNDEQELRTWISALVQGKDININEVQDIYVSKPSKRPNKK
ncbi:hypothetical protein AKO1_010517, partial [Acrasis kona]